MPLGRAVASTSYSEVLVVDEFFAARPDKYLVVAYDDLAADTVPLMLGLPLVGGAQFFGGVFQLIGQVEGIVTAYVVGRRFRVDQVFEGRIVRRPVAHQAVGQIGLLDTRGAGQGAVMSFWLTPTRKLPVMSLCEQVAFGGAEAAPGFLYGFFFA